MQPQIHFDYLEPKGWIGKTVKQLYEEMEKLRIAVKEAIGYTWDNSHFFIDDICGHPALQVAFFQQDISFWNAKNGTSLGAFTEFSEETFKELSEWIKNISEGLTKCNECGKWVKEYVPYSFAGAVCKKCYNPEKHLPPDTRGD